MNNLNRLVVAVYDKLLFGYLVTFQLIFKKRLMYKNPAHILALIKFYKCTIFNFLIIINRLYFDFKLSTTMQVSNVTQYKKYFIIISFLSKN